VLHEGVPIKQVVETMLQREVTPEN
jgi:hypothetical protein